MIKPIEFRPMPYFPDLIGRLMLNIKVKFFVRHLTVGGGSSGLSVIANNVSTSVKSCSHDTNMLKVTINTNNQSQKLPDKNTEQFQNSITKAYKQKLNLYY